MNSRGGNAWEICGPVARVFVAVWFALVLPEGVHAQDGVRAKDGAASPPEDLASRLVDELEKVQRLRAENVLLLHDVAALQQRARGR